MKIRMNDNNSRDNGNINNIMLITYRLYKKIEHVPAHTHTHTDVESCSLCVDVCVSERERERQGDFVYTEERNTNFAYV